jgi:hypothetical protein
MEETAYLTTVKGIYRDGRIELARVPQVPSETPVLVTFLASETVDLYARGIGKATARRLREQMASFAEEWESPEMDAYDNYDSAKLQTR